MMTRGRMKAERKRGKKNEVIQPRVTQDDDKFVKSEEQLLPGIPNEVTLDLITTKLRWRTFHTLSSVSRAWQQAIRDRLVYDARVRSNSAEAVVLVNGNKANDDNSTSSAIALYSLRDKRFFELPPIPKVGCGIPWKSQCIALYGKLYILGGVKEPNSYLDNPFELGSKKVYVLDLAGGQRQWKQCAKMQGGRSDFGCGVIDGKIYVFGGTSLHKAICESEVYDPTRNMWSAIRPMRCLPFRTNVAILGEELLVYAGLRYNRNHYLIYAQGIRAYHSVTNKWRLLSIDNGQDGRFTLHGDRLLFTAQGKLCSMSLDDIRVYDLNNNSWTKLHSNLFAAIPADEDLSDELLEAVLAVDNELLATVSGLSELNRAVTYLVQSRGFGSENKEIVWEKIQRSLSFWGWPGLVCPLQL